MEIIIITHFQKFTTTTTTLSLSTKKRKKGNKMSLSFEQKDWNKSAKEIVQFPWQFNR